MAKIDRRLFTRYKTNLPADVLTSNTNYSVQVIELSLYGIRISSVRGVNPGTPVVICIQIDEKILFRGDVMWALDHSGKYGSNYTMGIRTEALEFFNLRAPALSDRRILMEKILEHLQEDMTEAHA